MTSRDTRAGDLDRELLEAENRVQEPLQKRASATVPVAMVLILIWVALLCSSAVAEELASSSPDEAVVNALKLSTAYNSAVRPPPDHGHANTINVYIYLNTLVKVDSTAQELKLKVWMLVHWIDNRLAWKGRFNRSLDNISAIGVPASLLWQPDASFYDVVELTDQTEGKAIFTVMSTGLVVKSTGISLTTKCGLQMQRFPFDTQDCAVRVSTLQQVTGATQLQIRSLMEGDSPERYILKSSEFCIQWAKLENGKFGDYNAVLLRIGFQRIPTFYVVNLMLPSVLLLAISAIAFLMPPDCGERISYTITIVLSMCVFLQLAGNYTPTQSESVPLITWYFSVAVLLTIANVLCNAFVLSCHFKQHSSQCVSSRFTRAIFLNRFVVKKVTPIYPTCSENVGSQSSNMSSATNVRGSDWAVVRATADRMFFIAFSFAGLTMMFVPFTIYLMFMNMQCLGMN